MLSGAGRERVIIFIKVTAVLLSHISSSSYSKSIKLGVEPSLRLDERTTVIPHRLVTSIWIFGEHSIASCNEYHQQEDQGKGSIYDEKYYTHHTSNDSLSNVNNFYVIRTVCADLLVD